MMVINTRRRQKKVNSISRVKRWKIRIKRIQVMMELYI